MKTNILSLLFCLLLCIPFQGSSQSRTSQSLEPKLLIPFYQSTPQGTKQGYADSLGNIIITPRFDKVEFYSSARSLFEVKKEGKRGVVNANDQIVLDLKYHGVYIQDDAITVTQLVDNKYTKTALFSRQGDLLFPFGKQEFILYHDMHVVTDFKTNKSTAFILNKQQNKIKYVLPKSYDLITIKDSKIKAIDGDKTLIFEKDQKGRFHLKETLTDQTSFDYDEEVYEVMGEEEEEQYRIGRLPKATLDFIWTPFEYTKEQLKKSARWKRKNPLPKGGTIKIVLHSKNSSKKLNDTIFVEGTFDQFQQMELPKPYRKLKEYKGFKILEKFWVRTYKDNKQGTLFFDGTLHATPPTYSAINEEIVPYQCKSLYFKTKLNGLYGLIDKDGKVILEHKYESLSIDASEFIKGHRSRCFKWEEGLKAKKDGKNVLVIGPKLNALNRSYDDLEIHRLNYYGSYWLCYAKDGVSFYINGIESKATFPKNYRVKEINHRIKNYPMVLIEGEGEVKGYYNYKNGVRFF